MILVVWYGTGVGLLKTHTPINAFFQTEEFQALLVDLVADICTPEPTGIEAELFLFIGEFGLLDSFAEEIKQTSLDGDVFPMVTAVLEGFCYSSPYKVLDLGSHFVRDRVAIS